MKKRYWLRGGISGLIAVIVVILFIQITARPSGYEVDFQGIYLVRLILIGFGVPLVGGFIVGSAIGWIYGKIKNRNKVS